MRRIAILPLVWLLVAVVACNKQPQVVPAEVDNVPEAKREDNVRGIYILNGGGEGTSKATLDYLDATQGVYHRNIYGELNPSRLPALGDNATDIALHADRLFITLAGSHRVLVLKAENAEYVGEIPINDPRRVCFFQVNGQTKGYVASWKIQGLRDDQEPLGEIVRFDPQTLDIEARVTVGPQPNDMYVPTGANVMYVTNGGDYMAPNYARSISKINLESFAQTALVETEIVRPGRICPGVGVEDFWVVERGDFVTTMPSLAKLNRDNLASVTGRRPIAAVNVYYDGDLYSMNGEFRKSGWYGTPSFLSFSAINAESEAEPFISDGTIAEIQNANYFFIDKSHGGDYYVLDAKNYTSSGVLYCFTHEGKFRYKVRTGIVPTSLVVVEK